MLSQELSESKDPAADDYNTINELQLACPDDLYNVIHDKADSTKPPYEELRRGKTEHEYQKIGEGCKLLKNIVPDPPPKREEGNPANLPADFDGDGYEKPVSSEGVEKSECPQNQPSQAGSTIPPAREGKPTSLAADLDGYEKPDGQKRCEGSANKLSKDEHKDEGDIPAAELSGDCNESDDSDTYSDMSDYLQPVASADELSDGGDYDEACSPEHKITK